MWDREIMFAGKGLSLPQDRVKASKLQLELRE